MADRNMWCALSLLFGANAAAQTVLYGVRGNGDLLRIEPATGATVLVGSSGHTCNAAAAYVYHGGRFGSNYEYVLIGGGSGAEADQIIWLNRWTGAAGVFLNTTGRPAGYGIRGIALSGAGLYVVLSTDETTSIDLLARIDSGAYTVIGPTGRTDLEALTMSPSGVLYALGTGGGGNLYRLDMATGAATLVGGGQFGDDTQALEFLPDGTLLACRANLLSVNPSTGAAQLVGPTGFTDIRGLAALTACYINCDPGGIPCINVLDMGCFLNRFAAGDPYANCDLSTTPPVLNVLDFMCFLNRWAAGCSEC